MSTRIGLVGCSSTKTKHPAPARDLYTSALFRRSAAYAEATCERWFILSAKHGLVYPDEVIEHYDVRLGRATRYPETDAPPIHVWANRVRSQLDLVMTNAGIEDPLMVLLAAEIYEVALFRGPWAYETPLRGLGAGERLTWLKRAQP